MSNQKEYMFGDFLSNLVDSLRPDPRRKQYKRGIVKKMVFGIVFLSLITYTCTMICLYVIDDWLHQIFKGELSLIIVTVASALFWSGLLGWVVARLLTKPMLDLEEKAEAPARGDLSTEVSIPPLPAMRCKP